METPEIRNLIEKMSEGQSPEIVKFAKAIVDEINRTENVWFANWSLEMGQGICSQCENKVNRTDDVRIDMMGMVFCSSGCQVAHECKMEGIK